LACTALAVPDMFTSQSRQARGNQHSKAADGTVTKLALAKRMSGRLQTALVSAPTHVKSKWNEILALKGKRGSCIFAHKKDFLLKWVGDPTWEILLGLLALHVRHCLA
jgi:hypothetical protein